MHVGDHADKFLIKTGNDGHTSVELDGDELVVEVHHVGDGSYMGTKGSKDLGQADDSGPDEDIGGKSIWVVDQESKHLSSLVNLDIHLHVQEHGGNQSDQIKREVSVVRQNTKVDGSNVEDDEQSMDNDCKNSGHLDLSHDVWVILEEEDPKDEVID